MFLFTRIKLLMVIGGGVLAWFGFQELLLNSGSSSEAVVVDLAKLESGEPLGDNHVKFGEHLALYPECIYSYSTSSEYEAETPSTKVDYCYYPVISKSHPSHDDISAFRSKFGELSEVSLAEYPSLEPFALLVKTRRFRTVGDLPFDFATEPHLQGMVVNQVTSLANDERELLKESFPSMDFEKVVILEDGRAPSALKSYGMTFGGVLLTLVGIASFFIGRGSSESTIPLQS
ncbi:MAG: hypothetical protein RIC55_32555 [Pirellulaceae bacterium]